MTVLKADSLGSSLLQSIERLLDRRRRGRLAVPDVLGQAAGAHRVASPRLAVAFAKPGEVIRLLAAL
jgi:hypothetical protein